MSNDEIMVRLKELFQEYLLDDENIDIDLIDSFEFIQNILEIEELFDIEISDEMLDFEKFNNLQKISEYISERQRESMNIGFS